jgi:hypothetical protein
VGDGLRGVDEGDVDAKPVDTDRREDATGHRPALVADFMSRVDGGTNGTCDFRIDPIDHTLQVQVGVLVRGLRRDRPGDRNRDDRPRRLKLGDDRVK